MKISRSQLRRIIREEAGLPEKPQLNDSLDSQVDKYLTDYEQEANAAPVKTESVDLRDLTRRLFEGEDMAEGPTFNVESFVNDVLRLIDNYDSLLEVRDTILNRAKSFLAKAHSREDIAAFEKSLREEHGVVIGQSKQDVQDNEHPAPPAARAGGDDGGAGA